MVTSRVVQVSTRPTSVVIEGAEGNFYGTAINGSTAPAYPLGTVFKIAAGLSRRASWQQAVAAGVLKSAIGTNLEWKIWLRKPEASEPHRQRPSDICRSRISAYSEAAFPADNGSKRHCPYRSYRWPGAGTGEYKRRISCNIHPLRCTVAALVPAPDP